MSTMRKDSAPVLVRPSHGLFSRLHLRVMCNTEFGQTVHVSGSSFIHGKDNPSDALEMVTTPEEYPMWRTMKPIIVPRDEVHSYMYALFEGGKFKRWEALGAPRRRRCTQPMETAADEFDMPSSPSQRKHRQGSFGEDSSRHVRLPTAPANDPSAKVNKLWLVCFHLPVTLTRGEGKGEWKCVWNESLIAKTEDSVANKISTCWVGTISYSGQTTAFTLEEQEEIRAVLAPMDCTPIFCPPAMIDGSYLGYCKQILWPAFHNIDVLDLSSSRWNPASATTDSQAAVMPWDQGNTNAWFEAFRALNQTFADYIDTALGKSDVVWVHDYHLMLLPKMLADAEKARLGKRTLKMIFFMHIPFPTSQIFRSLAHGELLLQGMLSASIVGFHAFDHARHFLNTGKRLLGLSYQSIKGGLIGVEYDRRTVMVVMSHVGIEPGSLSKAMLNPAVDQDAALMRAKHGDRIIIGGLDVCQKLSGITLKLLAFETLLKEYPVWRSKVVLVQICLLPENRVEDEARTAKEINELVTRISAAFGEAVLDVQIVKGTSLPLLKRLALYRSSDVLACTAVREGLNLIPLEYIFTRKDPEPPGVVLASEFSACASILNGAIRINPFDMQRVAAAMDQALTMEKPERLGRRSRDMIYICSRPSSVWTDQVLNDMWAMAKEGTITHMEDTMGADNDLTHEMTLGGFTAIDSDEVVAAYQSSSRRVLLIDYGGTLLEKEGLGKYLKSENKSVSGRSLAPQVEAAITKLCADPKNTVFIISGLQMKGLCDAVGHIPRLGLGANNGLAFSWPQGTPGTRLSTAEREWELFDYGVDWKAVKDVALPLLLRFTAHTNGSSIKIRDTGIVWSYYATDPEWGQMQAKQLASELDTVLAAYNTKTQHVRGQVEVVPMQLHKGRVAKAILRKSITTSGGHYPDFVLCIGDDTSDEHIFTSVYSFLADVDVGAVPPKGSPEEKLREEAAMTRVYTCTVGKKPTHAAAYADDSAEVQELMVALGDATILEGQQQP